MRLSLLAVLLAVPLAVADDPEPPGKKLVAREIAVRRLPSGEAARCRRRSSPPRGG